jgi:ParB family chromosome partitioning protein
MDESLHAKWGGERMKPRRLGRGLDFLLSGPEQAPETAPSESIEISRIQSNPWQPRSKFDETQLDQLADSIRRHGVVQPIIVRKIADGEFQLVAGERRLIASRKAGLDRIPAVVRTMDDREMLVVALVENVQREDLGAIERARAFKRLGDEQGFSHQAIAEASGLGRSTVSNALRLLELDPESLGALERGDITEGHARALLAEIDLANRRQLLARMINEKMSVRTTEQEVKLGSLPTPPKHKKKGSADARALERRLTEATGLKVRIEERGTGGRVVISYATLADFDRLFTRLVGARPDELEEGAVA